MAIFWQFYLLFYKVKIQYYFQNSHPELNIIYKNSLVVKFSGLLYATKEPLLAVIFLALGDGFYSIFNYANKFSAAIFQITTTPIMNRFVTTIHYSVAEKKYREIEGKIRGILLQTVPVFLISSIVFYLFIPYSMPFFFKNLLMAKDIETMQLFYFYMSLFYLIIVFESPFANTISIFKLFNYQLFVNAIFFTFICMIYLLFKAALFNYNMYLFAIILAQAVNFFLYRQKSKAYLQGTL